MANTFEVYDLALALVVCMRKVVERIRQQDRDMALQLKRATSSVASNIGEGRRRTGKDRIHHYNIAAGSADEVRAQLNVACAWRDIDQASVVEPLEVIDRICAMLWRLSHPAA